MGLKGVITGLVAICALNACSGASLLNTITPSSSFDRQKNIRYGDGPRQVLDVYTPKKPKPDAPVLVFVHGGGWNSGDKHIYKFIGDGFAAKGYTVIVPNYRLYPDARYPAFVDDTAKAVSWAARTYKGRPLVLIGHSAGGYNALKVVFDPVFLEREQINICMAIGGVMALASPTGAEALKEEPYISVFPDRLAGDDAPLKNLSGPVPPVFLAIGDRDKSVGLHNHTDLYDKLKRQGSAVTHKIYKGLSHVDMVKMLSRYFDEDAPLKEDMLAFIQNIAKGHQDNYCK